MKSNMAATALLKNKKIMITQKTFNQFWRKTVWHTTTA